MIKDGFHLHAMDFLDYCLTVVRVQPRATKKLLASGCKSTWESVKVVKQHAALGFMQDSRNVHIKQMSSDAET